MSFQFTFLRGITAALLMAGAAVAEDAPSHDTVVATVNGHNITLGQMILTRATLPQQYASLPNDVLFQGILDQLVQQQVLAQSQKGEPPVSVQIALENQRLSLLASEAIEKALAGANNDAAIKAAYDAKYANFEGEREYNASHILVDTQEEAEAIRQSIVNGADFATQAKEKSTGPSGPSGGELGWFGPGMMVAPFEEAVRAMEVGAVSEPTQTQFGWHVIKLNDSRLQEVPALDDVRTEIEADVQNKVVEDLIASLTENAVINRDGAANMSPDLLTNIDLLEN